MNFVWGLIIGLVVGSCCGVLLMGIVTAGKMRDRVVFCKRLTIGNRTIERTGSWPAERGRTTSP